MELIELVFDHFNKLFSHLGICCIAGGAARDSLMGKQPKDYDFFILGNLNPLTKEEVNKVLASYVEISPLEFHKSEPYLVKTVKLPITTELVNGVSRWKIGDKDSVCWVEVQILLNPASDIQALINTFDWNVCLFAFGSQGYYIPNPNWKEEIKFGEPLKLNKVTFPLSTLRRGFRFSERFGMRLTREDAVSLCKLVIQNNERGLNVGPIGNEPDYPSLANNLLPE